MQLKIIWRESLPAVIFPGTWSKPERVMIGMWGVVQSFFFCLVVSFLAFRESVWFQEVGETDLMDCEPPLLGVTFGRIVQVHFSFAGIVWVMVLFLLPVVFQTKVARLTALVYFRSMKLGPNKQCRQPEVTIVWTFRQLLGRQTKTLLQQLLFFWLASSNHKYVI